MSLFSQPSQLFLAFIPWIDLRFVETTHSSAGFGLGYVESDPGLTQSVDGLFALDGQSACF